MEYKIIIAALKPSVTDQVVEAAKTCGISGATILPGRGTGTHEAKTFLGLTLEDQTDVVLFLAEVELIDARDVSQFALLVGYGAGAINPYLVFETIAELVEDGTFVPDEIDLARG